MNSIIQPDDVVILQRSARALDHEADVIAKGSGRWMKEIAERYRYLAKSLRKMSKQKERL